MLQFKLDSWGRLRGICGLRGPKSSARRGRKLCCMEVSSPRRLEGSLRGAHWAPV